MSGQRFLGAVYRRPAVSLVTLSEGGTTLATPRVRRRTTESYLKHMLGSLGGRSCGEARATTPRWPQPRRFSAARE